MPKKPKAVVLDSWAVIAYFEDEDAAAKVANIIADAHDERIPLLTTVVNAGEVWYIVAHQTSAADADASIKQLRDLGIQFVEADWSLAKEAGYFKSKNKMSLADAFAAVLAKQRRAHLATGDPEFKQIEKEVAINWLTEWFQTALPRSALDQISPTAITIRPTHNSLECGDPAPLCHKRSSTDTTPLKRNRSYALQQAPFVNIALVRERITNSY